MGVYRFGGAEFFETFTSEKNTNEFGTKPLNSFRFFVFCAVFRLTRLLWLAVMSSIPHQFAISFMFECSCTCAPCYQRMCHHQTNPRAHDLFAICIPLCVCVLWSRFQHIFGRARVCITPTPIHRYDRLYLHQPHFSRDNTCTVFAYVCPIYLMCSICV